MRVRERNGDKIVEVVEAHSTAGDVIVNEHTPQYTPQDSAVTLWSIQKNRYSII
jgi:hypothetical protein